MGAPMRQGVEAEPPDAGGFAKAARVRSLRAKDAAIIDGGRRASRSRPRRARCSSNRSPAGRAGLTVYRRPAGKGSVLPLPAMRGGERDRHAAGRRRAVQRLGRTSAARLSSRAGPEPRPAATSRRAGQLAVNYDGRRGEAGVRDLQGRDQVPLDVIRRKGVEARREAAGLLLYGYGGYGVNQTPAFLGATRRMLARRAAAIFVIANLRGGGEYGEELAHARAS